MKSMAKHDSVLAVSGQNKICRCDDFFLERNLIVTGDLIKLPQFFSRMPFALSRHRLFVFARTRIPSKILGGEFESLQNRDRTKTAG